MTEPDLNAMREAAEKATPWSGRKVGLEERQAFERLWNPANAKWLLSCLEQAERERDEATSTSVTVGSGLSVYGSMDALRRVQNYIMLDSTHPVEREDVRRSLARDLQAAESALATAREEIERLKEGLKPFAERGARYGSTIGDEWVVDDGDGLTVADMRRAARALLQPPAPSREDGSSVARDALPSVENQY